MNQEVTNTVTSTDVCMTKNQLINTTDVCMAKNQALNATDVSMTDKNQVINTIDIHVAKNLLNEGYRYLDVRTEEEFKKGHVENSFNVPYMFKTPTGKVKNAKFLEEVLGLCGKDDHLVVGCQSGGRSLYATTELLQAEFKHVHNMGGGFNEWTANGFFIAK